MYHRNVKLNFKSFVSTLLAVLLMAGVVSTQTMSPTYPKWPDIRRQNPAIVNTQDLGANGANANGQRPSIKDLMLGKEEPPPPRENPGARIGKSKTPAQQKLNPDRAGVSTIPHWSDSYTYQGLTYKYTMVGTDPKKGSATTTIPTVIIPIRFIFPAGTTSESPAFGVTDTEISIGLETGTVDKIVNSPIFRPHDFSVGGVSVGNTQYGDAFQRANFWGSVSNGSHDYHVLLGQPTVLPVDVVIPVVPNDPYRAEIFLSNSAGPPPDGGPAPGADPTPGVPPMGELRVVNAAIRADVFREAIENAIRQSGVTPQMLPIILFDGKIYTWEPQDGKVNGLGFNGTFEVPGGLQTFIASAVFERNVQFGQAFPIDWGTNAAYFPSRYILDWLNNPFDANFTPGYLLSPVSTTHDLPQVQCLSDDINGKLRVGGINAGELPPFVTPDWYPPLPPGFGYGHDLADGYPIDTDTGRYTLANGSFIDAYTRRTPTQSPAGRYTFFDVIRVLRNLDETGRLTILFRAPDLLITSPAPPCVGHVEVEKQIIEYPNALWTRAYGINNLGTIVGQFKDASNVRHAFIYDRGRYSSFDYPGARLTIPNAINDHGQIVGWFFDGADVPHGFLYFQGNFTPIDFPGSSDTLARSINNRGDITGLYDGTQPVTHGFVFESGKYRAIDSPYFEYPQYVVPQTDVTAINDRGQMVGFAWFDHLFEKQEAFSLDRGVFTALPRFCPCYGDLFSPASITYPRTINNAGEYGGWRNSGTVFFPHNDGNFGYVTIHGYTHTIDGYGVYGMNDHGQIVGYDFDYDRWRWIGYVATLPK
jgi:probable HAF family extracellular repeat protein